MNSHHFCHRSTTNSTSFPRVSELMTSMSQPLHRPWFHSDLPDDCVSVQNYDVFVKSRSRRKGGGVALYVKQSLNPQPVPDVVVPDDLEVVWLKLHPERLQRSVSIIVVAAIYHPPNAATANDLIDHLLEAMDIIATKHPNAGFVLMGDFNKLDRRV